MNREWTSRTSLLIGDNNIEKLAQCHVLVVGLGGVGAYAAEMLCRAGIGKMTIVDADVVNTTNLNRQLVALNSTLGLTKATVLAHRLRDINPLIKLTVYEEFVTDERTLSLLDEATYDYVVDAIDTLSPKSYLLFHALQRGFKVASSMGAGGKCDPTAIKISDISKTTHCALARAVRKRLIKMGVNSGIKVVYTTESANDEAVNESNDERNKRSTVGTISYMPAAFGCFLASIVLNDLIENKQ
jgi:tRNA threonylcarbamoyladenosine dehydratase